MGGEGQDRGFRSQDSEVRIAIARRKEDAANYLLSLNSVEVDWDVTAKEAFNSAATGVLDVVKVLTFPIGILFLH